MLCFLLHILLFLPMLTRATGRSLNVDDVASGCERKQVGSKLELNQWSSSWIKSADFPIRKLLDDVPIPPTGYQTTESITDVSLQEDEAARPKGKPKLKDYVIIASLLLIFVAICLYVYLTWRKLPNFSSDAERNVEDFLAIHTHLATRRYRFSEIKRITDCFQSKIGQGGYGTVYKGTLYDGTAVAVKMLSEAQATGEEFVNEVAIISRTNHVNVVTLLGFCSEGSKRSLIYEYMPHGSLDRFLFSGDVHGGSTTAPLTWEQRLEIALGIARGLEYLHLGCNTRIIHLDIKPHNILLGEGLLPKISDFGLAKLCRAGESELPTVSYARGTTGYVAPEVFSRNFGVVSSKSDVYSYGMMVLEMVGGRRNSETGADNASEVYFPHWIHEHLDEESGLGACGVTPGSEEVARKMILVGLWCIQTNPASRPSISEVVEMLEGSVHRLEIPPKLYVASSPQRSRHEPS